MFANILWKINFSLPLWKIVSTAMAPDFSNIFSCFGLQALREGADGADHEEPHPCLLLLLRHGPDLPESVQATLVLFLALYHPNHLNMKKGNSVFQSCGLAGTLLCPALPCQESPTSTCWVVASGVARSSLADFPALFFYFCHRTQISTDKFSRTIN